MSRALVVSIVLMASSAQAGIHDVKCDAFLEAGSFTDSRMVGLVAGLRDGFITGLVVGSIIKGGDTTPEIDAWSEWMVKQPGDTLALMLRDQCNKKTDATMGEAFTQMMVDAARERGLLLVPNVPELDL